MKIYTKTGDHGDAGLSGGKRVSKASLRIAALGDVDELNAQLGLCRHLAHNTIFELRLAAFQSALFKLGAELSAPNDGKLSFQLIDDDDVRMIEESIDMQVDELPALTHFILPGGCELAAHFHIARAVCRRAERAIVALHAEEPVRPVTLRFANRLSDWLFTAGRTANQLSNVEEMKWNSEE